MRRCHCRGYFWRPCEGDGAGQELLWDSSEGGWRPRGSRGWVLGVFLTFAWFKCSLSPGSGVADMALGGCQLCGDGEQEELHFHHCQPRVSPGAGEGCACAGLSQAVLDSRKWRCFPVASQGPALLCSEILGQVWGCSVL